MRRSPYNFVVLKVYLSFHHKRFTIRSAAPREQFRILFHLGL